MLSNASMARGYMTTVLSCFCETGRHGLRKLSGQHRELGESIHRNKAHQDNHGEWESNMASKKDASTTNCHLLYE
jgi:hypothetical protein